MYLLSGTGENLRAAVSYVSMWLSSQPVSGMGIVVMTSNPHPQVEHETSSAHIGM